MQSCASQINFFITNIIKIDAFIIGLKCAYRQTAKIIQDFIKINCKIKINNTLKETFLYIYTPFSLDIMVEEWRTSQMRMQQSVLLIKLKEIYLYSKKNYLFAFFYPTIEIMCVINKIFFLITNIIKIMLLFNGIKFVYRQIAKIIQEFIKLNCKVKK